jgi:hypothetical protein
MTTCERTYPMMQRLLLHPELFDRESLRVTGAQLVDGHCIPVANDCAEGVIWSVVATTSSGHTVTVADCDTMPAAGALVRRLRRFTSMVTGADLIDAAACLWEAALELKGSPLIAPAIERFGTAEVRTAVVRHAAVCHLQWVEAVEESGYDDAFDWEWCPKFLTERLDWSAGLPFLKV